MKKFSSIVLVLGLSFLNATAADKNNVSHNVGTNFQYREKDTTRTFALLSDDRDDVIEKLIQSISSPLTQTKTGLLLWKGVSIDGLGTNFTIEILDGIMVSDKERHTARFTAFATAEDKKKAISTINQKDIWRTTELTISDENGDNVVNSAEKEAIVKAYLKQLLG